MCCLPVSLFILFVFSDLLSVVQTNLSLLWWCLIPHKICNHCTTATEKKLQRFNSNLDDWVHYLKKNHNMAFVRMQFLSYIQFVSSDGLSVVVTSCVDESRLHDDFVF